MDDRLEELKDQLQENYNAVKNLKQQKRQKRLFMTDAKLDVKACALEQKVIETEIKKLEGFLDRLHAGEAKFKDRADTAWKEIKQANAEIKNIKAHNKQLRSEIRKVEGRFTGE